MADPRRNGTGAEIEAPDEQQPRRGRGWTLGRILLWVVVLVALFVILRLGIFDQPSGPPAGEVEATISDAAPDSAQVSVVCPDDSEDTDVGDTFTCTATAANGRTAEIEVTVEDGRYSADTGPLSTLQ